MVVAGTVTRSGSVPMAPASRARIFGTDGPILGRSPTSTQSAFTRSKPAPRTTWQVAPRRLIDEAPCQAGVPGGKSSPMSPSPSDPEGRGSNTCGWSARPVPGAESGFPKLDAREHQRHAFAQGVCIDADPNAQGVTVQGCCPDLAAVEHRDRLRARLPSTRRRDRGHARRSRRGARPRPWWRGIAACA